MGGLSCDIIGDGRGADRAIVSPDNKRSPEPPLFGRQTDKPPGRQTVLQCDFTTLLCDQCLKELIVGVSILGFHITCRNRELSPMSQAEGARKSDFHCPISSWTHLALYGTPTPRADLAISNPSISTLLLCLLISSPEAASTRAFLTYSSMWGMTAEEYTRSRFQLQEFDPQSFTGFFLNRTSPTSTWIFT